MLVLCVGLLVAAGLAPAAQLLQNGGFEDGLNHWVGNGNGLGPFFVPTISGLHSLEGGCVGGECVTEQTVTTVPGEVYLLSGLFHIYNDDASGSLYWNGALVDRILGNSGGNVLLSGNVVGNGSDVVGVGIRDDPAFSTADDISLVGAVPEPSTFLLAGLALAIPVLRMRRKQA
jgi:hypothetical protein